MNQNILNRIQSTSPKKILACDGGGIRGLMSVEILAKIEAELRAASNKPDLVLADYFDFVCGTSTGAIIATCIASGMAMDTIRQFYLNSGKQMFDKAWLFNQLKYKYNDESLANLLKTALDKQLQETNATLGSANLKTLLMMVMRNHTTDSPWPVSNNPYAKYNDHNRKDCNLNLPLWQLVRASTAAPTFFPPEVVTFAENTPDEYTFIFVDGAVTTYNNPAYLAFQMAATKPYAINWQTGAELMLVVSVGTGSAANARLNLKGDDLWLLDHAKNIPSALMNAANASTDMVCRVLGECRHGGIIDSEFGDMVMSSPDEANFTGNKLFTYLRYDPDLSQAGLNDLGLKDIEAFKVQQLDSVSAIPDMQRVGNQYAAQHVDINHFKGFV